jgi:hypothetical protein
MNAQKKLGLTAAAMGGLIAGSAAFAQAQITAPSPRHHNSLATPAAKTGVKSAQLADEGQGTTQPGDKAAKHDCKGKNDCKGQGGCKTSDNGCVGKNSCKGKGGCSSAMGGTTKPSN